MMCRRVLTLLLCAGSLLCLMPPRTAHGTVLYTFTGTYSPYSVAISFETSLTGAALDNLVSSDITATVSNFSETNTIGGNLSVPLSVIVSTNALGNITSFTITDTLGEVVTNTTDSVLTSFIASSVDLAGRPLLSTSVSATDILGRYQTVPNDFFCKWFTSTGLLEQDHDNGFCTPVAAVVSENPPASGSGTFTSTPPNPGAPNAAVPEPSSVLLLGIGALGIGWRVTRRR